MSVSPAHRLMPPVSWFVVIGSLCLVASFFIQGAIAADSKTQTKSETKKVAEIIPPRVTVAPAIRREIVETVVATGTLVPREQVLVGPEIEGLRILKILVEEGQTVKKGQVLIHLSRETLDAKIAQSDAGLARADASIAQAKSQIVAAEITVKLARQELERAQKLLKRGASTRAIIEQKLSAFNTGNAQLQVARDTLVAVKADKNSLQAQRRELMISVARTLIRAPEDGLIAKRNAKVGAVATASGSPLFEIIAKGEVELDAEVPEQKVLSLKTGQSANVVLANGVSIKGKVRLVMPQIDPATRLGHVRVSLSQTASGGGLVRAGAFARAVITIRKSQSLSVPSSAIIYSNGATKVHVAEGGVVKTKTVQLGLIYKAQAEIKKGLSEGDRVVLRAGAFLRNGDAIIAVLSGAKTR